MDREKERGIPIPHGNYHWNTPWTEGPSLLPKRPPLLPGPWIQLSPSFGPMRTGTRWTRWTGTPFGERKRGTGPFGTPKACFWFKVSGHLRQVRSPDIPFLFASVVKSGWSPGFFGVPRKDSKENLKPTRLCMHLQVISGEFLRFHSLPSASVTCIHSLAWQDVGGSRKSHITTAGPTSH